MTSENNESHSASLDLVGTVASSLPWLKALVELWKIGRKALRGFADEGIYEVLEYESTLELKDTRGEHAVFHKRERVRYLQNGIIAYQDQAWGDGKILIDYRCTPGVPVDRYRPAQKTYILISLREVRNRGDIDEFNIEWGIHQGFRRPIESWATEVADRTRKLKVQVIFPQTRPPLRTWLVEGIRQRTHPLGQEAQIQLPDGRWLISWDTSSPRLNEQYILKWEW